VASQTTRYGRLVDLQLTVEGNHVYLGLEFTTGDASGQNMVTIAAEAICRYIDAHTPVKPRYWYVEANMSGDKKATTHSFMSVRGKKVSAEVTIPAEVLERRLHTTADANGGLLADVGAGRRDDGQHRRPWPLCQRPRRAVHRLRAGRRVRRRSVRRCDALRGEADGALYAAVTLPNMIVGTVGGGTGLPTQRPAWRSWALAGRVTRGR
jgi:hydroxymethylglutaryl-CoA reductase (NADPH)